MDGLVRNQWTNEIGISGRMESEWVDGLRRNTHGGRWTIQGTLRQGTITLIHGNGKRTNYGYRVHCRGSECYGSEYFFNGKLYSVKYIYR